MQRGKADRPQRTTAAGIDIPGSRSLRRALPPDQPDRNACTAEGREPRPLTRAGGRRCSSRCICGSILVCPPQPPEAQRDPCPPPLRRREDPGLHPGPRRPLRLLPTRPARRRRHQGGTARRRGHAPHPALPRMGRSGDGALMAGDQRQQTQPDAGPAPAGSGGHRQAPGRPDRRGDGEFPRRRDGPPGHRLRRIVGSEPAADLLFGVRLRPDRPVSRRGRL